MNDCKYILHLRLIYFPFHKDVHGHDSFLPQFSYLPQLISIIDSFIDCTSLSSRNNFIATKSSFCIAIKLETLIKPFLTAKFSNHIPYYHKWLLSSHK